MLIKSGGSSMDAALALLQAAASPEETEKRMKVLQEYEVSLVAREVEVAKREAAAEQIERQAAEALEEARKGGQTLLAQARGDRESAATVRKRADVVLKEAADILLKAEQTLVAAEAERKEAAERVKAAAEAEKSAVDAIADLEIKKKEYRAFVQGLSEQLN